jgi:hypothetical protein
MVKARVGSGFPADITFESPLELTKTGRNYHFSLNAEYLADAEQAVIDAQAQVAAATTAAETAATSEANALTYRNAAQTAQTNAETAETNAETAETNAETAQTAAEAAQTAAEAAQTAAETARDAAFANANVYADIATGLAAVGDGEQFMVVEGDEIVRYEDDAGSEVEVARYPTADGAYSPELWRINHKRAETARVGGVYDVLNRQVFANIALRSATHNDDGTITIPAGDYIMSEQWGAAYSGTTDAANPSLWWYLHVGVADLSTGDVTLSAKYNATDYVTGGGALTGTTETKTAPGVKKLALRNNNGSGTAYNWVRWFIHAPAGSDITIYPPIYTTDDISYAPEFATSVDNYAVSSPAVWSKDWSQIPNYGGGRFVDAKRVTKAADSVNGSSGNAGTLRAPKDTMAGLSTLAAEAVVGLFRGSVFREVVPVFDAAAPKGIEIIDVGLGLTTPLPKASAFKAVPDGSWTDNLDGTYSYSWTSTNSLVDNGYDEVFPIRVDTTLAAADYPITREERLTKVASGAACVSTVDSYYVTGSGTSWTMMIHPPDGAAPGTRYTYEVIDRYNNATFSAYARDASVRGVHLSGSCFGYGPLGAPTDFHGDRLILTHPNTHAAVIQGGKLERFLVYGKGNPSLAAVTFYTGNATGQRGVCRDGYVLGIVGGGFYSHNTGGNGQAWEELINENVAYVSVGRLASGSLPPATALGDANAKKVIHRRLHVDGFSLGAGPNSAFGDSLIERCTFRQVSVNRSAKLFKNNICAYENYGDPGNVNNRSSKMMEIATGHVVRNNLLYAKYVDQGVGSSDTATRALIGTAGGNIPNNITFKKNIIVFGADIVTAYFIANLNSGYSGLDIDYNVYIHVSGVTAATGTQFTGSSTKDWATYLAQNGGLDANSLYLDLRSDIRGVQAVFVDPDNGDFRFSQTHAAATVREYCLANDVGPDWTINQWPIIPTADEVARMIERI